MSHEHWWVERPGDPVRRLFVYDCACGAVKYLRVLGRRIRTTRTRIVNAKKRERANAGP